MGHCNPAAWEILKNVLGIVNGKRVNIYVQQNVKDVDAVIEQIDNPKTKKQQPTLQELHLPDPPQPQVPKHVQELKAQLAGKLKKQAEAQNTAQPKPMVEEVEEVEPEIIEDETPEEDDETIEVDLLEEVEQPVKMDKVEFIDETKPKRQRRGRPKKQNN